MTKEYQDSCRILGLQPEAGADEIKRAYFRLVRQHPPEKDPEQFQQIRHAYEILKAGPPAVEQQTFPIPENRMVRYCLQQMSILLEDGDANAAAGCLALALEHEPDDPFLLLNLARMQRAAGNPRKSAKTAKRLQELVPDCAEAYVLAADGMYEGGWYKKALPDYRKAYELGWREEDFLIDYADVAQANRQFETAENLRRDLLQNTRWNAERIETAIYLFCCRADGFCHPEEEPALAFLEEYEAFLTSHRRLIRELKTEPTMPLFLIAETRPKILRFQSVCKKLDVLLQMAGSLWNAENDIIHASRVHMLCLMLKQDSVLSDYLWRCLATAGLEDEEDRRLQRYAILDSLLCLRKEPEKARKGVKRIRKIYPFFYEEARDYLELLVAGEEMDGQFQKFAREYERLSEEYQGGFYYKRYPEEKPLPRGVLAYSDSVPFVRETKKPGRNDPCPCGSGRKFKKCCIGKGIYD